MPVEQADAPLLNAIFHSYPLATAHALDTCPPLQHFQRTPRNSTLVATNPFSSYRPSRLGGMTQARGEHTPAPTHNTSPPKVIEPKFQSNNRLSRSSPSRPPGLHAINPGMDSPSSPSGLRPQQSPSRHHGRSALSSLQGLSPMPTPSIPLPSPSSHTRSISGESDGRSAGGHSRTGSVTRSLSRRQSLYHSAAEWGVGKEYSNENLTSPASLFSRLTLVKAPASEQSGLRK